MSRSKTFKRRDEGVGWGDGSGGGGGRTRGGVKGTIADKQDNGVKLPGPTLKA